MIQNARDAICALNKIDSHFSTGKISIYIEKRDDGIWVTVSDNGVGMSLATVKQYLLNFGSSFWLSDLAKKEFVGLRSSGFKSVGQFGIGFYAVFMVAKKVIINTRKYDDSLDDNIEIKFPEGLCLHPIFSYKRGASNESTTISFLIDDNKVKWNEKYTLKPSLNGSKPFEVPYSSIVANITAGLDVDVYYSELGNEPVLIHRNIKTMQEGSAEMREWMEDISYAKYRENRIYLDYIANNINRMRRIMVDGEIVGIAALNTLWNARNTYFDVSTVGGLSNLANGADNKDYMGCMICQPITAKRETTEESFDKSAWANEQYNILCARGLTNEDKLFLPYYLGKYNIDMTDDMFLSVLDTSGKNVCMIEIKQLIKDILNSNKKLIIGLSNILGNDRAEIYIDTFRTSINLTKQDILFVPVKNSGFLSVKTNDKEFQNNILWCIEKASKDMGVTVNISICNGKVFSRFEGPIDSLDISFESQK